MWRRSIIKKIWSCFFVAASPRPGVSASLLLAVVCAACIFVYGGDSQTFKEYDLKAVFLYNFTQFVEWPPEAFANESAPIVIGVLGEDRFGGSLDETVRNEKVRNRRLVVQRYLRVEDIQTCHILFISRSETRRLDQILEKLKLRGKSILTVGESEGFTQQGGIIGFTTEQNRIRLRINMEAARMANLIMSSKLLRVADPG
jgi:hypothetical protein